MTDPRDPIEAWLSRDVELLSPPPGTFQRVHRRARRRKAVRTISATAGAAVVVAAVATLPQVASNMIPGSGGPSRVVTGSASPGPQSASRTISPGPAASPGVRTPAGPALSTAGQGSPPAADFDPTSVTFVRAPSGAVLGAVLGHAGSSCGGPCTVVAGTPDYGNKWTKVGGPQVGTPNGSLGVSQIRFLDQQNGWAYGPALYATHDGGRSWNQITSLRGRVIDLSTVSGRVFAVAATCSGSAASYATNCTSFALYAASAGSDRWTAVRGARASTPASVGGLQLTGQRGYLLAGRRLFTGLIASDTWRALPRPAAGEPACLGGTQRQATGPTPALIAPTGSSLFLACPQAGQVRLYSSPDAGQTWQAHGVIGAQGRATSLAASPGGALVLATTAGIYYSPDARTWQAAAVAAQVPHGFSFVGMTTNSNGVAVPTDPGLHELFTTRDGGQSWQPSVIR